MKYYFLFVYGCVEPEIYGPYDTEEERDKAAKDFWQENGDMEHGIFRIAIENPNNLNVGSFTDDELANG